MANILAIIEKVIEEHKIILADFATLEQVVNDAGALLLMKKSKEDFMPGRPSPREALQTLDESRNKVARGLDIHFNREETALLEAFQEYGRQDFIVGLKILLNEHLGIRSELSELKGLLSELLTEDLSRHLWESKGYDMRARITELHRTMSVHASNEQVLLHKVQKDIKDHH